MSVDKQPASNWNTPRSRISWSGHRRDLFAWGICHHTGIFSPNGSPLETWVESAGTTSSQEVWVKVSETKIDILVKNDGNQVFKTWFSRKGLQWFPTVTMRSPALEVEFIELSPSEIKEFDS